MELTVQGKQMDVGDALKTHVADKLEDINSKYLDHAAFATVTFSREGHGHKQTKTNIRVQVGKNIHIVGDAVESDPYVSFDSAADKVGKQMRRYKRKIRDHHERQEKSAETEILKGRYYTIQASEDQNNEAEEVADEPLVIAEMATDVETMSVSEAVMRMDLAGTNAFMFRNVKNNALNVVYRRADGNIGWIDPEGA